MDQIGGRYWKKQEKGEVEYVVTSPGTIELVNDTSGRFHVNKLPPEIGVTYEKMVFWGYKYISPKEGLFSKLYKTLKDGNL